MKKGTGGLSRYSSSISEFIQDYVEPSAQWAIMSCQYVVIMTSVTPCQSEMCVEEYHVCILEKQFCAEYFGQHNSYDIKHNVEPCEHNEDKLQEIQNSIMRENMSILSSGLPVHIDQCGCITLTASVRPKGHSPQGRCLQNQQGSHFLGSWSIMRVRWPP